MKPVVVLNNAVRSRAVRSDGGLSEIRQWLVDRSVTARLVLGRLAHEGRYGVLSFVVVLLFASVLLVGVAAFQYAAPFVYTVF